MGVAISDALGITAQGKPTVRRQNLKADLAELKALIGDHDVTKIVIGLPLNMDGSEGPRAAFSREFGDKLAKLTGLEIIYWDERLTTAAAQRLLIEADVRREKRKQVVDQMAAVLILQTWLDAQSGNQPDYDPESE